MINRLHITLTALVALLSLSPVLADDPPDDARLMGQLSRFDYASRQRARKRLLLRDDLTEQGYKRLIDQAKFPEQRHRILDAARHHMLRKSIVRDFQGHVPGSLGVRLHEASDEATLRAGAPAVRLGATMPGFPAYASIEPGDLLVAVNQQNIPVGKTARSGLAEVVSQMIRTNIADREITLTVFRRGRLVDVRVTLAPYNALDSRTQKSIFTPYGHLRPKYQLEWRELRARLVADVTLEAPMTVTIPVQ
ncbi:MAG: PDZ domain-containing protein [Pirellulaceae bacterium]|jgi:hypothetical protein|nr:hypothetical protein [Phycisphaerae bacterium]MDP6154133.1 PDZ domain-containing protein [Phycisphaeraceae bacterium]MDP7304368.1 PDZ domain-containing protein [Pirellulaceae bacterium]